MTRGARLLWLGLFAVGCFAPKIKLVDSFPDDGTSGSENGGSGTAGGAGHTSTNGGGMPMSGNSSVVEAGAGGMEEAAGSTSMSGAGGAPSAGAGGAGSGGTPTGGAPAGGAPAGGAAAGGAPAGGSGGSGPPPITSVKISAGCGLDAPQATGTTVPYMMSTTGTKPAGCADSLCGAWTYTRDYYLTLPIGYDKNKAYPLVFQGGGCSSTGTAVYPLNDASNVANAGNSVIRVGMTPPPNTIGHSTNPGQLCFDDREGDDSVDFVFYENLYDKLTAQLCVDKNRVFASGDSSGSWLGNELVCKYAGDATRPIRGSITNTGGLPTDPKYVPVCTTKPMAGMWISETMDPENPFANIVVAINRAIAVNGCTGGDYATAPTANYAIGAGNADTVCKQLTGCPALYPLVVCAIVGNQHQSHSNVANPGFSTFLKAFEAAPLLTP